MSWSLQREIDAMRAAAAEMDRCWFATAGAWDDRARASFEASHVHPLREASSRYLAAMQQAAEEAGQCAGSLGHGR